MWPSPPGWTAEEGIVIEPYAFHASAVVEAGAILFVVAILLRAGSRLWRLVRSGKGRGYDV